MFNFLVLIFFFLDTPNKADDERSPSRKYIKQKAGRIVVKLLSEAGTGFFYTATKNPRKTQHKIAFRKYDPIVRQHVLFSETKITSGKKK